MEGWQKVVLFVCTIFQTLATVWWVIPFFVDIWLPTATRSGAYALGFVLGFAICVAWIELMRYWQKY